MRFTKLLQGAIMWYTCRITRASTSTGSFQHRVLEDLSGVAEASCPGAYTRIACHASEPPGQRNMDLHK
jgi:hypothetical protein